MKKIKHASVIPLNGGMSTGAKMTLGSDPEWAISWKAFEKNESHFKKNFQKTPFLTLESEDKKEFSRAARDFLNGKDEVDIISAVPPCAGLSMLNSTTGSSSKARGSDAEQNRWMRYATELSLEAIKPRVIFLENAPGLLQNAGKGMVSYFKEVAQTNNYGLSFLFTDSLLHGIPQSRKRSFVFFWKDGRTPEWITWNKPRKTFEELMSSVDKTKPENKLTPSGILKDDPFYQYARKELGKGWRDEVEKYKTIAQWIVKTNRTDDILRKTDSDKAKKIVNRWKMKMENDKGFWDSTPLVYKDHTNAVIAKNCGTVHPTEDRFLNVRELMTLMGLPDWYECQLNESGNVEGGWNVLCQSVPSTTASDMYKYIEQVLTDQIPFSDKKISAWNNITGKPIEV